MQRQVQLENGEKIPTRQENNAPTRAQDIE